MSFLWILTIGLGFCYSFPTPVTMASENQTIVISDELKKLSVSGADGDDKNAPFADIDKLLEGDDDNKTKAYQLLEDLVEKVSEIYDFFALE